MTRARTRMRLALAGLAVLATSGGFAPADAQFYPYPPQRPYYGPNPYGGYPQPDPYGRYYAPRRPVVVGNVCYTSRGVCPSRPVPEGSLCSCIIPGFGRKQGNVVADPRF